MTLKLPSDELIAELKGKHKEVFLVEFGDTGGFIHRKPSQAECDEYFAKDYSSKEQEGSGNLIFQVRLWPTVDKLDAMLDEAPAVVTECATTILGTAGASPIEILEVTNLRELSTLVGEDLETLESRVGKKVADIENEHPRGSLRWCRIPGIGPSILRRPSRMSFGAFEDSRKTPANLGQAGRELTSDSAVTDLDALAGAFSRYPAFSYYLAWALAKLAGKHLEVRSGKL